MNLPSFLINSENIYIVKIDTGGTIIFSNPFLNKKINGPATGLTGLNIAELISPGDVPKIYGLLNDYTATKNTNITTELALKNEASGNIDIRWEFSPAENGIAGTKEIIGIGYEISDIQTKTRETEELVNIVMDSLPGIFYLMDETGRYLKWNKNFEKVSGYTAGEIPFLGPLAFFDKKDHEHIINAIIKGFTEGTIEVEAEVVTRDKQVIPYFFNGRAINYQGKKCLIGAGIDITQQVIARLGIMESEKKYHSLFEQASDPIMITDFEGNFIDVNTNMCNMFGYTKEELLKMHIAALIDPGELKASPIRFDLLAAGRHIFSDRKMLHRNGSIVNVQANIKKFGEHYVMAIARDVTELKKVEANLAAHEKQLRLFVEHSPAAIAMFDKEMRYINVSRRWISDYNLTGNDVTGKLHYDVFPGIPQHWKDIHRRCIAGATEKNEEDSFIRADGSTDWLRWEIHPWYKAFGEIGGIIMLTEVITGKKNTELALKEAESKFRDLVEKSLTGVYIMQHGKYMYVNPGFAEIFGYGQEELIESYPVEIVADEEDSKKVLENIRAGMEGGMDSVHYELRGRKKNGDKIWVEVFGSRTMYKGSIAIIGTLIDITERKQAAEENERIRYMLNERVKELTTLYRFSRLLQAGQLSLEELLKELVLVLPEGWQYPEITAARIVYGNTEYKTPNFTTGPHRQKESFQTPDGTNITIEILYLEQRPDAEEGPFAAEERRLISMLAEMFRIYLAKKTESEALKKSEANLLTIFDTTDTIYVLLDKKFRIISYNKPAIDFSVKELNHTIEISDYIIDYFPGEKRPALLKQMKKALAGGHVNYEWVYGQPDGSSNWYDMRILSITGFGGEVFGIIMAVLDITEKKLLEAEILEQKIQEQKRTIRAIINAQEKERNHIGQELHDNINQILAGTKMYLGVAAKKNAEIKEAVKYPMELIDTSIEEIRLLCSKMVTPLKNIDLEELLHDLLAKLDQNRVTKTTLTYVVPNKLLTDDLKLNIYRIVQEQVNNILKYAEAKHVTICIEAQDKTICIIVSDDGKGFDVEKKRKGIGISNMINRVETFNGTVEIKSSPGSGCRINVTIPC